LGRSFVVGAALAGLAAATAEAGDLRSYRVVDGGIPAPLSATAGDPARGMQAAADRQRGNCILCHRMPTTAADDGFQGDAGPDLAGVAARLSAAEMRLRVVDPTRTNPDTIMPAYYRVEGLNRVAAEFRGKPVLTAEEVEDVVAYLMTLR
jgi:sulfur-oxidizing protein SoxX